MAVTDEVEPSDITWELLPDAEEWAALLREQLGHDGYAEMRRAFQSFMSKYFSSDAGCARPLFRSVAPMGVNPTGGKCLKVRWMLPGHGKQGGLRLAVIAYCEVRRVKIAQMWPRKDDPGDGDFKAAFAKAIPQPQ